MKISVNKEILHVYCSHEFAFEFFYFLLILIFLLLLIHYIGINFLNETLIFSLSFRDGRGTTGIEVVQYGIILPPPPRNLLTVPFEVNSIRSR